jgi:uncharacterized MnhB-related membrane protein
MAAMIWIFDILLGLGLLVMAYSVAQSRNLYQAVVMFMVFGLLVALSWVRLGAPDIALAEAAIGAGVTGALFLSTIGRLNAIRQQRAQLPDEGMKKE